MRVAINGFGRIGRLVLRAALKNKLNIVAINDPGENEALAHLLEHDSIHGRADFKVSYNKNNLIIRGKRIKVFHQKDPSLLPWKKEKVDLVLECSGQFRTLETVSAHIHSGAKKVIISAPSKDDKIKTFVYGVNHTKLKKSDKIISNASCTTNCLAPLLQLINKKYGIVKGTMSTIHAYTSSQPIVDLNKGDLRRDRAGALNIIPTTTGATNAVIKVLPELKGKITGMSFRVPVACGSLIDFTCNLKKSCSKSDLDNLIKNASKSKYKHIIEFSDEPNVSSDIIGNSNSAVYDSLATTVNGKMLKLIAWYDNEWGYSCRMVDLVNYMKKLK